MSNAGGGIERLLNPPDEHRRIHPTAPAIRLDATGLCVYCRQTFGKGATMLTIEAVGLGTADQMGQTCALDLGMSIL